jgi:hypothetical protein
VTDRCNLAVRAGEGISHLRRFYFNTLTRKCVEYVYKGTKGNENSFLTLDECRATCESRRKNLRRKYEINSINKNKEGLGLDWLNKEDFIRNFHVNFIA